MCHRFYYPYYKPCETAPLSCRCGVFCTSSRKTNQYTYLFEGISIRIKLPYFAWLIKAVWNSNLLTSLTEFWERAEICNKVTRILFVVANTLMAFDTSQNLLWNRFKLVRISQLGWNLLFKKKVKKKKSKRCISHNKI